MLSRSTSLPDAKTLQKKQVPLFTTAPRSWFPNLVQPPIDERSKYFDALCIELPTNGTDQRNATDLQYDELITNYDPLPPLTRPLQALEADDALEYATQQRFRQLCEAGNTLQGLIYYVDEEDKRVSEMGSIAKDISGNTRKLLNLYGTGQPLLIDAMSMAPLRTAQEDDLRDLERSFSDLWLEKRALSAVLELIRAQRNRACFTSTRTRIVHLAVCIVDAQILRVQSKWAAALVVWKDLLNNSPSLCAKTPPHPYASQVLHLWPHGTHTHALPYRSIRNELRWNELWKGIR